MNTKHETVRITPGSSFFVGRETEVTAIKQALARTNAVLLFGGRQSGKTSLLRNLQKRNSTERHETSVLSSCELYVYIDLNELHYQATPETFYALLGMKAARSCEAMITGFQCPPIDSEYQLDGLISLFAVIRAGCSQVDVRFVFLLDEAKRILGDRFPRGFQDNLFALLFGEAAETARASIVFAGTQHLNEFLKDDTSPIGSRSQSVHLSNLDSSSLEILFADAIAKSGKLVGDLDPSTNLIQYTGGHAGLTARLTEAFVASDGIQHLSDLAEDLYLSSLTLFENWILSLSAEAKEIAATCSSCAQITLQQAASQLETRGFEKFLARRVFEELQYTGLVSRTADTIRPSNPLFWRYFSLFGDIKGYLSAKNSVWMVIAETELAMRELISVKLESRYGISWQDTLPQVLGDHVWEGILAIRQKSSIQYRFSRQQTQRELMSCMYLGQLGMIMINRKNWDLFKEPYRDKRELEDKLAAIMPVRNDNAHFSVVPQKEEDRCRIACDDLLTIVEKETAKLNLLKILDNQSMVT